ncbi:hypothetical protein H6P81_005095 [Aristolochia fimbriata]|uniref:SMODS-associated and fused to various effectors domain-containing protein n=1 Tax=Aristolochia fimbriata TaxID=158543 RepID=A0AAV7EX16_ARIFI|nr:hypothetical protein H6P81_005095 [Aristolochia fimbriata]
MGNLLTFGFIGQGKKVLNNITDKLYEEYRESFDNEEKFQTAIIEIFNRINGAMLGTHYDPPALSEVENYYKQWSEASSPSAKKQVFADMIQTLLSSVKERKTSSLTMLAGVGAPPAFMIAKRVGENIPGIKKIRIIPDYVLVPSATVMTLIGVKFLQFNVKREM